jgi:hypothetical protein
MADDRTGPTLRYKTLSLYCFCDIAIVFPMASSQATFYKLFGLNTGICLDLMHIVNVYFTLYCT